ncbi:hypothetical protein MNV49_005035 [Pseudohyphozyma bogoriensis]|nr:hypothetical protein MNV49_005035 [Pseudohyphozyma bogoriensis]
MSRRGVYLASHAPYGALGAIPRLSAGQKYYRALEELERRTLVLQKLGGAGNFAVVAAASTGVAAVSHALLMREREVAVTEKESGWENVEPEFSPLVPERRGGLPDVRRQLDGIASRFPLQTRRQPRPLSTLAPPALRPSIQRRQLQLSRGYATTKVSRVADLLDKYGRDKVVDLSKIMADLEDLENLDALYAKKPSSALYPLWHFAENESGKAEVTLGELVDTLSPVFSYAWTAIIERMSERKVAKLAELDSEDKAALLFMKIYSIGPKRARKFAEEGIKSFAGLAKQKLTKAQKIGLRHREDIGRLITREEMEQLYETLEGILKAVDERFEFAMLGSYRRGVKFSSDVDMVIRHPKFTDETDENVGKALMTKIVDGLRQRELISKDDELANGPKRHATLIKLPEGKHFRRIDIRLAPFGAYPYMLLGSTGDALLLKFLRARAKSKGWCLNEYGMGQAYRPEDENPNGFRPGTSKMVKNEREIFDLLGYPWLEPHERDFTVWGPKYKEAGIDISYAEKA